jgi:hypothetical protein
LNINLKNNANLSGDQLTTIENQIAALFATSDTGAASSVGVNFVSSGSADYTLNISNAAPGHTDLGHQTGIGIFQFSPVIHPNNISSSFSALDAGTQNIIMGTIGAHELIHRIDNIGDLPYNPAHPNDIMSSDNNPDDYNKLAQNAYRLTDKEIQRLLQQCLKKHPN